MKKFHKHIYDVNKKEIIGDFDKAYKHDDAWLNQYNTDQAKYRLIYGVICDEKPQRVLDIGCGYGAFVEFLERKGFKSTGIEMSPTAISKGKEKLGDNIDLRVGDIRMGLDFPDESFDSILLLGVFWFILDEIDFCLNEINRVLKQNGKLFVSVFIPEDPIGKEKMNDYSDFINYIENKFDITDAVTFHEHNFIQKKNSLSKSQKDMLLICKK